MKKLALTPVEYTEEDHDVWRTVLKRIQPLHEAKACSVFLDQSTTMLGSYDTSIPQQSEISEKLEALTGFCIRPATSLMKTVPFLRSLARRTFCATQFIRSTQTPFFSSEPDWIHELLGHAVVLGNPMIADVYVSFGRAAECAKTQNQYDQLQKLFWFTAESSLVREGGRWKALGAAILSSVTEMESFDSNLIRPFDPHEPTKHDFDYRQCQDELFGATSVEALCESTKQYLEEHFRV